MTQTHEESDFSGLNVMLILRLDFQDFTDNEDSTITGW